MKAGPTSLIFACSLLLLANICAGQASAPPGKRGAVKSGSFGSGPAASSDKPTPGPAANPAAANAVAPNSGVPNSGVPNSGTPNKGPANTGATNTAAPIPAAAKAAVGGEALEPDDFISRHPWGSFPPGAWKRVRVVSQTFDDKGRVTSTGTSDTTTTLTQVDENDYTLRLEVAVEVSGKRFLSQPQVLRQGYYGEPVGQDVVDRKTADQVLTINGASIPCELREIVISGDKGKRFCLLQYSNRTPPYSLKSLTTAIGPDGKAQLASTQVEAVALEMPYKVGAEIKSTSFVKTVHARGSEGSTVTLEVHCADVPGGVVAHTSREADGQGRLTRRTTLELLEYNPGPNDDAAGARRRLFHRSRTRPPGAPERPPSSGGNESPRDRR